jgi:GDP-D-mannose 3', 5'-epimerase
MSEKIMVTGGAGMIGSNLVKRLVKNGFHVTVVDNLWRGKIEYLQNDNGKFAIDIENDFHNIDLTIPELVDSLVANMDYVIHLADIVAGIGYVFNNQGSIFRQNILINSNMISAVRKTSLKGYLYVGTACSFPAHLQTGTDAAPLREIDQYPANPESAYGWSKLMGEYEALLMEGETSCPVSILALHNVYGGPCNLDKNRSQVIPALITKAIQYPKEPFIVWGSGSQGRAFVHVNDVVDALIAALEKGLGQGLIQIGPNICTSIKEIAETIVDISRKNIEIEYDLTKPEGDKGRCADYSKAKEILNWEPKVDLYTGLNELYQWIERQ